MNRFPIKTAHHAYDAIVGRGALQLLSEHIPAGAGLCFVVTTEDVWRLHGDSFLGALGDRPHHVLFFPGGESRKRFSEVEALAEQVIAFGGDRSSAVIAFGGGIVNDLGGFLAAIFMRGVPVIQVPTTLLAQVDASVGGKTGVNLVAGKNLIGSFHQPLVVLIDPSFLETLPEREYRAGLFEIVKCGIIADEELFWLLRHESGEVLSQAPGIVDRIISASVRIKAEVVSADEKEGGLRRILNFGHTFGHALEAETHYSRFLHGEAVAFGMRAAVILAREEKMVSESDATELDACIAAYGPIPSRAGISAANLAGRLRSDKKTIQNKIHFVLPDRIGHVRIVSGLEETRVLAAIEMALGN